MSRVLFTFVDLFLKKFPRPLQGPWKTFIILGKKIMPLDFSDTV
ncbi:hypothetical protein Ssal_00468 [Streptococcus salivarius 57.I]|nr:hypothetical protein Ssal_00468 [Streptococcus salivarius 57.I]